MHLTQNGEKICLLLREKRQCFCVNKNSLEKDLAQKSIISYKSCSLSYKRKVDVIRRIGEYFVLRKLFPGYTPCIYCGNKECKRVGQMCLVLAG